MHTRLIGTLILSLLLTSPALAQSSCPDGQSLDPDTGGCVVGGGSDPGTGPTDDGLIPRLLRFLTPDAGDEFTAGTEVAPTGRTSLTNVQDLPLDLTIVIDDSQSMRAPTNLLNTDTPDPTDRLSRLDIVKQGVSDLLGALSDDAVVTVIGFGHAVQSLTEKYIDANGDGVSDMGTNASRQQSIDFVNTFQGRGSQTRYDLALTETLTLDNRGALAGFTLDAYDKELLFLSDGLPTAQNYFTQLNALPFRGIDSLFVSLPGNVPQGNAVLEQAANRTNGSFIDFSGDALGLLNAFGDPATALFGITSLEITNPDGTRYFADTDPFGNFTLDPFALSEGDNLFSATALFENGTSFSDTLTLVGTAGTTAPPAVPLPAAGWLLGGLMVGGAAWGRRKTRTPRR